MELQLRDYQAEALERIARAEARGCRRQLIVMATGLGKTIVFAALAASRPGRTLVLAHRDELVAQAAAKLAEVWPALHATPAAAKMMAETGNSHHARLAILGKGMQLGIVKAKADDTGADVVVASVQTLASEKRLARLATSGPFDLVVIDEAHHATAASYRAVLDALRCGRGWEAAPDCDCTPMSSMNYSECPHLPDPPGPLLVGVTATPDRGDGTGLDAVFDEVVANRDILYGIKAGHLCQLRALRIEVEHLDLGSVKVSRGDYQAGAAGEALEAAGGPRQIVAAWMEHALGRRTLVFTPTVATAEQTAGEFAAAGVRAGIVHGGTPLDERRAVLAAYSAGDIDVLCNCAVLTEGYDEPRTDCVIVARPTKSRALYTQMVGRGTRRHPDKVDCLVLDMVDATREHSLVTIPSLFGLDDPAFRAQLEDGSRGLSDVVDDHAEELVRVGRLKAEEAELFGTLRERGKIAWVAHHFDDGRKRYERDLHTRKDPTAPVVVIAQMTPDPEGWKAGLRDTSTGRVRHATLIADVDIETAQAVAEEFIRTRYPETLALASTDAPWRARPPSAKALAAAKRWRIPAAKIAACETAGELSDLMDAYIALRTRGGRGR